MQLSVPLWHVMAVDAILFISECFMRPFTVGISIHLGSFLGSFLPALPYVVEDLDTNRDIIFWGNSNITYISYS